MKKRWGAYWELQEADKLEPVDGHNQNLPQVEAMKQESKVKLGYIAVSSKA